MNPLALIVKLLMGNAISTHNQKQAEKNLQIAKENVENIFMNYFCGPITDLIEQEWILQNKIRPMVSKMNVKELNKIISEQKKNEKLIQKGKPAKTVLVKNTTIRQYHIEYLEFKHRKEQAEIRKEREREQMRREARIANLHNIEIKRAREAEILINGESDDEIANKFFE